MPAINTTPLQFRLHACLTRRRDEPHGTTAGQGPQRDPHTVLLSHTSRLTFSLGTSWTRTSSVIVPTTTAVLLHFLVVAPLVSDAGEGILDCKLAQLHRNFLSFLQILPRL